MEVILKKDVENLGFVNDLVEVKNGYGRNYLIPQGIAVLATVSAKKVNAETMRQRAHRDEKLIKDAKKVAATLEEVTLKILSKSADGDKLFGSVTNADIAEALGKQGYEFEKKFITVDGRNIKRVGEYVAHIRLHRELVFDLPFSIHADPAFIIKKSKATKPSEDDVVVREEDDEFAHKKESIDMVASMARNKKPDAAEDTFDTEITETEAVKSESAEADLVEKVVNEVKTEAKNTKKTEE